MNSECMRLCILTMDDISKTCTIFLERYCRKIFAGTRDVSLITFVQGKSKC